MRCRPRFVPALVATTLLLVATTVGSAPEGQAQPWPAGFHHDVMADRTAIALVNAGVTGVLSLTRGVVSGNVRDVPDGLVAFGTGAVAGLGFYEAKRQIGLDRIAFGTALAFASASVVENVASGEHPLGYLRAGPGPFDLRVRTPLARGAGPAVRLEIDPVATIGSAVMPLAGYRADFCGFTLCFRGESDPETFHQGGLAVGRLILVSGDATPMVVTHEMIHYVQAVQLSAVTAFRTTGEIGLLGRPDGRWDLKADWLMGLSGLAMMLVPYHDRWTEIEAFTLMAQPPPFTRF
jgi:hypothetical protein